MKIKLAALSLAITSIITTSIHAQSGIPSLMLASTYQQSVPSVSDWSLYWMSEKLDGIRAYWTGEKLVTRNGNLISAPEWFTSALPPVAVDGELWAGRGKFQWVMATVLDSEPEESAWREIRFMAFDLPAELGEFRHRYHQLGQLVDEANSEHFLRVGHLPVISESRLRKALEDINADGGEGLMLRRIDSDYLSGRSNALLKVKSYQDAEATVIGMVEGKGKYEGKMGSLIVKMTDGTEFRIGTGFTDRQRETPPSVGTVITFKYNGLTDRGVPRFARFSFVDETRQ